jgi:hypothetical protein
MKRPLCFAIVYSLLAVFVFCRSAQSASPDVVVSQLYSSQVANATATTGTLITLNPAGLPLALQLR